MLKVSKKIIKPIKSNLVTSRQAHGFKSENRQIYEFNFLKTKSGHKWDGYTKSGIPISMKCIGDKNAICLGKMKRNQDIDEDFIFIVEYWTGKNKDIIKRHILFIDHTVYTKLCYFDKLDEFEFDMKHNITNSIEDDPKWKIMMANYQNCYPSQNLISMAPKRDHKTQKRIQCTIPHRNKQSFYNLFRELAPEELLEM
jgi:hypothetical protein